MKLARLIFFPVLLLTLSVLLPANTSAEGGSLSISGVIWQDTNADGIRQPDEPGLPNIPVELGTTYNGQYFYNNAAGLPLYPGKNGAPAFTDANGAYTFEGLNPGPYSVRVFGSSTFNPYVETYPLRRGAGEYSTAISIDSQSVKSIDFGLIRPEGVRTLIGQAWIDSTPVTNPKVRAVIDGIDCTGPRPILPTDQARNVFSVGIMPDSLVPGCGGPGKTVSFTINGRAANETVQWSPPPSPGILPPPSPSPYLRIDLTAGLPFGYILSSYDYFQGAYLDPASISAEVDGIECGRGTLDAGATIYVPIPSEQITPGCGRAGADVVVLQDGVPVAGPLPWHKGQIVTDNSIFVGRPYPPTPSDISNQ